MKVQFKSSIMLMAEHLAMGLELARRFAGAAKTRRFSSNLLDQARAWNYAMTDGAPRPRKKPRKGAKAA